MQILLQAGGTYYGWRYATEAELSTLWQNAGIVIPNVMYVEEMLAYMEMAGLSYTIGAPGDSFYRRALNGTLDIPFGLGRQTAGLTVDMNGSAYDYVTGGTLWGSSTDTYAGDSGHFLVREGRVVSNEDSSWGEIKSLFR